MSTTLLRLALTLFALLSPTPLFAHHFHSTLVDYDVPLGSSLIAVNPVTGEPAIVYSKGMGGPPVIYIAERSGGTWTRSTVPQIHNFQSFDFAPDGTPVIIAGTSGSNLVRSRRQSGVWSSDEIIGTDDNFA
jgi:hypothetical protein